MDEQGGEQRLDAVSLASLTSLGAATKAAHDRDKKRALRERNLLDLSTRLATLADDPGAWFSDVVLHLGPQREPVPAHRAVLATASPILHALLLSSASSSQAGAVAELELPDVDPQTFKMLLRFVYSGALHAGSGLSTDAGLQLLELAERFDVPGLAGVCLDVRLALDFILFIHYHSIIIFISLILQLTINQSTPFTRNDKSNEE